ncbi:class I SAM-dependent methyltransferase [Paenibacillus sp. FSL W8-0187]|uniref:class I SAM-dependent methyltransferase n=1 Tax=Paenibacillus sp. FSL W8-0187 TaxID=2921710 RepID=UPI0030D8FE98
MNKTFSNIHNTNKIYWDENGNDFLEAIVLPYYGCNTLTENELNLFGDVAGKKLLDIGCGNGESLKYHGNNKAAELWGIDISKNQIEKAAKCLSESGYTAKLICGAMEEEHGLPSDYFDYVYSIYAIGWTTDIQGTFNRVASYLKKDGVFIFSWSHPIHMSVAFEEGRAFFKNSYFDETWSERDLDGKNVFLCSRKISTYVNTLAKAGFVIEQLIEQTNDETLQLTGELSDWNKKSQMVPLTAIFKARKL